MIPFLYFSGRILEGRIKVSRFAETSNKVGKKDMTRCKKSNKEVKIKVRRKYFLNNYLLLYLILILYFVRRKEKAVC